MTAVAKIEPNTRMHNLASGADHVVADDGTSRQGGDEMFSNGGIWTRAIDEFSDWLVTYRENLPGTVRLRRCHLRALAAAHLRRSPWRVTTDDLAAWIARQEWERATRDSYRSTIRMFYQWAEETRRLKKSPASKLRGSGRTRKIPRGVPEKALASALGYANDRDRLIIVLGAWGGLRRGEIAGLRWDNRHGKHLWVTGKGDHERRVPGGGIIGTELDAEWARRAGGEMGTGFRYPHPDSPYVFPGRDGDRPMSPESIGRAASRALPADYSTHSLRHRFGVIGYATTRDLRAVQEALGHHSPTVTQIYTYLTDDALDALADAIQPSST